MNIRAFLCSLTLVLTSESFAQSISGTVTPTKVGHMVKVGDSIFVDLALVKRIEGKIMVYHTNSIRELSLSEKGIAEAVELLKTQIAKGDTRLGVTTFVVFDDKGLVPFASGPEPSVTDITAATEGMRNSLKYLDEILKLVP